MATFNCDGIDGLILSMEEVAEIPVEVQDEILKAQAGVVVKAQKETGRAYGVNRTGVTLNSIKQTKPKTGKDGNRVISVYAHGKNENGTRNAEVAFVNEYGKRGQRARPFTRDANEKSAEATTAAGFDVYDKWLKSKNL